jgi:hypothetical protein
MAYKSNGVGSVIRNPLIATMVILLIVMIASFASNYYFINQESLRKSSYLGYSSELKVLSHEIAKHSASASHGNIDSLDILNTARG